MFDSVLIWSVIAALLGITVVRKAVIIVRQGYEYTLERFGRYRATLLLPVEASGILSSLSGITEVAREAFDKGGASRQG